MGRDLDLGGRSCGPRTGDSFAQKDLFGRERIQKAPFRSLTEELPFEPVQLAGQLIMGGEERSHVLHVHRRCPLLVRHASLFTACDALGQALFHPE